jgi:hypothetical protein
LPPLAASVSTEILKPLPKPRFDFTADSCYIGTYLNWKKSRDNEATFLKLYIKGGNLCAELIYYKWPEYAEGAKQDIIKHLCIYRHNIHPSFLSDSSVLIGDLLFSNDTLWTLTSNIYITNEYGNPIPDSPMQREDIAWLVHDWRTFRQDKAARLAACKYLDTTTIFFANHDGTRQTRPHRLYWNGSDYIWEEYGESLILQHYPVKIALHGNKYSITAKRDPKTDPNVEHPPLMNKAFWYDSLVYEPGTDTLWRYIVREGKQVQWFAAKIVKHWEYDYGLVDASIVNGTHNKFIEEWRMQKANGLFDNALFTDYSHE